MPEDPAADLAVDLATELDELFRGEPNPDAAEQRGRRVLEAAGAALQRAPGATRDRLARALRVLCARAPFFAPVLLRHPDWLAELADDDAKEPRDLDAYRRALDAHMAPIRTRPGGDGDGAPELALREFKYRELARITIRDCCEDLVPLDRVGETLREISHLAEALIETACRLASERVAVRRGPPVWRRADGGEETLGFCVLGLGKLGNEELNYSSDVDLVYVHSAPSAPAVEGPRGLSPLEYFTAVAQELGRILQATLREGFLYRVDLDLRPEGSGGTLVVSESALESYYEVWAATWEKAAFMKARPVAGDRELGWRAIRAIDPMLYRSVRDWGAVDAIRELKQRIEDERVRASAGFDVKLGVGGIRDVEFVAQALQMLHGGRIPQVRARSTEAALERLSEVGVMSTDRARELLAAYRFLRRLEIRLQMEAERQTHLLPADPAAHDRMARALGYAAPGAEDDPALRFDRDLERHRAVARRGFTDFDSHAGVDRILDLFQQTAPELLALPGIRRMIEQLAAQLARQIDASPAPERALQNLERFIEAQGRRHFYWELLLDRPELVPRLVSLFGASNYLSSTLSGNPRLIETVFDDPTHLVFTPDQLRADLAAIQSGLEAEGRDPVEAGLDALRLFQHRQVLNVGLLDVDGKIDASETEGALSDIAEACIEGALALARRELGARGPADEVAFLVVAMGKLGTRELSYGSDLDVIFLFDPPADAPDAALPEAQARCARLAQRLISVLGTRTPAGTCYEVDARLRPSGSQGVLVTSLAAFRRYHGLAGADGPGGSAQIWERQALLRARPLPFEDPRARALAAAFERDRTTLLERPLPAEAAAEIRRIRQRMEDELARETRSRQDFKLGRGGLSDVETAVQYLQLLHGREQPELLEAVRMETQLERLARAGRLDESAAAPLRDGLSFLKRLGSRMRIVENRSISDLDHERGDLEALARSLGYGPGGREGGARRALLNDYRRHTAAVRDAFEAILPSE